MDFNKHCLELIIRMSIILDLEPISDDMNFMHFRCGNGIIDNEIATNAFFYNLSCEARSFAILLQERIIGCAIIGITTIEAQVDENVRSYYAIEIRTLAISKEEQRKGYGSTILDGLIARARDCAEFCGCRYVILTAVPEMVQWYERRGFSFFPYKKQNKMYIDFRNEIAYNDYADQ